MAPDFYGHWNLYAKDLLERILRHSRDPFLFLRIIKCDEVELVIRVPRIFWATSIAESSEKLDTKTRRQKYRDCVIVIGLNGLADCNFNEATFGVRIDCSGVIACCLSGWMNTLAVFNREKKKRVRSSNGTEKSSGSYYPSVFNWDLIDPSIIHPDCQWAFYGGVCNRCFTFVALNPYYEIQFMLFVALFIYLCLSFVLLIIS